MKPLTKATAELLKPINLHSSDRLHISLDREGKFFHCKFYSLAYDGRHTGPSYHADKFINRFPEKKKLDGWPPVFEVACTDYAAQLIDIVWPKAQLDITDEAKIALAYLLVTCRQQDDNARVYAEFKQHLEQKTTISINGEYEIHPDNPLAVYQKVALHNSMRSEGYGLFMEQGTGKTPVVIARICNEAVQLREGHIDVADHRKNANVVLARAEGQVTAMKEELTQKLKDQFKNKEEKLKRAARAQAAKKRVHLAYDGSADMLLIKAREAVREAEMWLGRRLAQITDEMEKIRVAATQITEARIAAEEARIMSEAQITIAGLKKKRVPGEKRMYRAIIVCPNNVRLNWFHEFCKFTTRQGKVTVIRGGEIVRTKQLIDAFTPDDPDDLFTVVVVSYDTLKQHWDKGFSMIEWDLGVLDESHFIKWPETGRHKYAMKLRDKCKAKMVLTGTPITNTGLDLYAQFEFMGEGWSGFGYWKNFRTFYGVYKPSTTGRQALVGMQNLPFIQERLARLSFSIDKTEVLPDLPKKSYDIYEVEMTKKQTEMYVKLRDTLAVEIENELAKEDKKSIVVNNILTKLLRLAQITAGHIRWDDEMSDEGEVLNVGGIERFTPNPKVEAVLDILQNNTAKNSKVLIWCTFVADIKALVDALTAAKIDHVTYYGGTSDKAREEAVPRFNCDPTCKVMIGNPAAGGVGLNLVGFDPNNPDDYETNCDHVIYFSQNWSAVQRSQSEDRAHRRNTRVPIQYTDLVVADTIDEEIRDRVTMKRLTAASISDIQEILKNVLRKELL